MIVMMVMTVIMMMPANDERMLQNREGSFVLMLMVLMVSMILILILMVQTVVTMKGCCRTEKAADTNAGCLDPATAA